jgi:glucan phosphoethanolaminetransferase (alkaline phosphatase superfamily)
VRTIALKLVVAIFCLLPYVAQFLFVKNDFGSIQPFVFLCLVITGLFILAGLRFWWLALPLLILSGCFTAFNALTGTFMSPMVALSIFGSDSAESIEFIQSAFFIKFLVIVVATVAIPLISGKLLSPPRPEAPPATAALSLTLTGLVLLAWFHHSNSFHEGRFYAYRDGLFRYYPLRQWITVRRGFLQTALVIRQYEAQTQPAALTLNNEGVSVLLVVGEAARKKSMSAYGHFLSTTPFVDDMLLKQSQRVVLFSDALAVSPLTNISVPSLLSMADARNFKQIGNHPSLFLALENSPVMTTMIEHKKNLLGFHNQLIGIIAKDNKELIYHGSQHGYDEALLKPLNKTLMKKTDGKPRLITLHLAGSHYAYNKRYPSEHECFLPDTPDAHYLSSIRYTDHILKLVMERLDQLQEPVAVLYAPDHGEYVNDDNDGIYGHGFKTLSAQEIEIPFFMLFNHALIKQNPEIISVLKQHANMKVSHDNISHTVMGLLGATKSRHYQQRHGE